MRTQIPPPEKPIGQRRPVWRSGGASPSLLLILCCAVSSEAQADPQSRDDSAAQSQDLPTIEVTGTRLRRTDFETSSPVEVISREDIALSGKRTLSEVVRSITADSNGSIGLGNVSGFAMGSSGVALRGLTVNATLVLINGRRMASYGLADDGQRTFVNLSSIPLDVVERVEVLKDGGSAIYGAEAIAGVVNIILREQFEGVAAHVSYAVTEYGDGEAPRASITAGRGNLAADGYNIFFSAEGSRQKAMYSRERDDRRWIGTGDLRPYGYSLSAGGIGPNISGWFDNTSGFALSNRYGVVSDAALETPVWQQLPGCQSQISLPAPLGGCPWDRVRETGVIHPKEDKLNLYLRGSMRLADSFNPYVEVSRFATDTASPWVLGLTDANESWVDPARNAVVDNSLIELPANHPDNPLGVNARLRYLFAELGPRTFEHDSTSWRAVAGTRGKLGEWEYDAGLLYARNNTERIITGFVRDSVFKSGLNGTGANGFYRIGANSGLNSAAFMQALSPRLASANVSTLRLLDIKASRQSLQLPGGPLGISLGAEYRRETLDAPPMPLTDVGDLIGWSYYTYSGEQSVFSLFTEVAAPLAESLTLDAALRVDDVRDTGTFTSPKLGFKWKPWQRIAFRGTYSRGFRAPNPAERGPNNQFAGTLDMTGNGFLGVFRNLSNPDLKAERSHMVTLGGVLEPWEAATVTLNVWWLARTNEINSVDPFAIVAGVPGWPHARVVRDAAGDVLEVSTPYENNSRSRLRGIDVEAGQRVQVGRAGTLSGRVAWTLIAAYRKKFTGGVDLDYAGTHGPMVVSGNTGTPKNKAHAALSWDARAYGLSAYLNFIGGFANKDNQLASCASTFADGTPAPTGCHIASFTTVDLRGSYRPLPTMDVYLAVTNVFDRIAPLDPVAYINLDFDPALHLDGAIGRTFNLGLSYGF